MTALAVLCVVAVVGLALWSAWRADQAVIALEIDQLDNDGHPEPERTDR